MEDFFVVAAAGSPTTFSRVSEGFFFPPCYVPLAKVVLEFLFFPALCSG